MEDTTICVTNYLHATRIISSALTYMKKTFMFHRKQPPSSSQVPSQATGLLLKPFNSNPSFAELLSLQISKWQIFTRQAPLALAPTPYLITFGKRWLFNVTILISFIILIAWSTLWSIEAGFYLHNWSFIHKYADFDLMLAIFSSMEKEEGYLTVQKTG